MKDYLHDADDYAHLSADLPPCGKCANYVPSGAMGWASGGAIHGKGDGWCLDLEFKVRGDKHMNNCPFWQGRA